MSSSGLRWPPAATAGRVRFGAYLALHDRRLLLDYTSWVIGSRRSRAVEPAAPQRVSPLSPDAARAALIGERLGLHDEGPALATARTQAAGSIGRAAELSSMAGDLSLGELVYEIVRGLRPKVVLETGVAHGITSAYILAALSDNSGGELHSIDLPSLRMIRTHLVGSAVPDTLRGRWTYHWGSSRRLLPGLLARLGPQVGLFVHDSDHSYLNMSRELEGAWRALPAGAWIVADDVNMHAAFHDFAASHRLDPWYVSQRDKPGWTGIVMK